MLGLVPVLAAVLATQGAFNPPASRQQAPQVAAAPTVPVSGATLQPTAEATAVAPSAATSGTAPAAASTGAATSSSGTAATATPVGTNATSGGGTTGSATSAATDTDAGNRRTTGNTTSEGSGTSSTAYVAYRVQPGDTVRFVARTYGVSAASIIQASGLSNPDLLHVGQVLTVPSQPGWVYRVQPGETLDQIAARTGVAGDRIASASGLSIASVGPGAVLLIPDQAAAAQGK